MTFLHYIPNLIFIIILGFGIGYFATNVRKLIRNIKLGTDIDVSQNKKERLLNMLYIAFGQSKMVKRPFVGIMHVIVYVGFVIINLEVLEIILDGILGTHRIFAFLDTIYDTLIACFECLAFSVLVTVVVFWIRRNVANIKRLATLKGWSKKDGNLILYFEVILMCLFFIMNATDLELQTRGVEHYLAAGYFPISIYLVPLLEGFSNTTLIVIERMAWWLHIIGILGFLNYLYYSKHLHILLAFPNTYFGSVKPQGAFQNNPAVTQEVKLMLDPDADPYAMPQQDDTDTPSRFGAKDIFDLNWIQLMNAYTCTECGRCTSSCPAHETGKKLSPRKIMMDTRDRLEEVGKNLDLNKGTFKEDGKSLLNDYISTEELWACTSCNACVEECPVSISPLSIIMDMRQYLVMEESAAPSDLNVMMSNIENNGAPWPFNQMDRLNWNNEV